MDDDARTLLELLGRAVEKREQAGVHQQALVTQIAHTTFEAEQACERLLEEQRKELAAFRAAELARAKEKADAIVAAARAEEATACARIEERQQRFESECASEREQLEALAAKEEEIQARVAAMNACVAADRPHEFVELRVGGQLFETTICNLTRCPHSVLAVLWHQHSTGKDSSGPLRVDGDPSHFHLILSYLRSGKLPITTDVSQLQWLEAQADEYKLNGKGELADLCRAHRRRNPLRSPTLSPFGGGGAPGFGMKPATAPGAFGSLTSSNRELGSSSTSTELPCNKGTGAADDVRTDSTCTELPAYQPVPERDHKTGSLHYYVSITTMPQYQNVSFEELRYKDYIKGNKGAGNAICGFGTPASSLFGAPAASPSQGLF